MLDDSPCVLHGQSTHRCAEVDRTRAVPPGAVAVTTVRSALTVRLAGSSVIHLRRSGADRLTAAPPGRTHALTHATAGAHTSDESR